MKTENFNLLDESWIPVLYHDGRWQQIGLLQAFQDAREIRQVATTNPMDTVAILRFLLAVAYWSLGNPPQDSQVILTDDCVSHLKANRKFFNLLGDGERFYQDNAAQRRRATTDLLQEIPTGNNFWHFRHSTDFQNGLCLVCCARGLLRLPLFSVSGLPDLKAGINGTPPIYVLPLGQSLLETLSLNWKYRETLGAPTWSHSPVNHSSADPVPTLLGLTILSRRVKLHGPIESHDKCMGCGAGTGVLVYTCEFQSAGEQKTDLWDDPHVVYSDTTPRKASKAQDLSASGAFKMDRPWTYLLKGLIDSGKIGPNKEATTFLIVGFATDKAKNIDVWQREVRIPPGGAIEEVAATRAIKWHKEGLRMEKRLGRWEKLRTAALTSVRPDVEHRVSDNLGNLVVSSDESWCEEADKYRPLVGMLANALYPGISTKALRQRNEVSRLTPYMRVDEKPVKGKRKPVK